MDRYHGKKRLFRLNTITGKWRRIAENPIAYYGNVLSIAGKDNPVWISTLNGVARFDLKETNYDLNEPIGFTNYSKKDGLAATAYMPSSSTKEPVWFATDGAGVTMLDKGVFINFTAHNLFRRRSRIRWPKTAGNISGSVHTTTDFLNTTKSSFATIPGTGLPTSRSHSIAVDDYDNIIAVNKKASMYSTGKKIPYSISAPNQTSANSNPISIRYPKPGWKGLDRHQQRHCMFRPQSIDERVRSQAVIEQVLLFNQRVDTARQKTFRYDQNNFSFRIAAIHYKAPGKIRFQYWLEGYNKQWEITGDRTISFAWLHRAGYLLKIRASAR